jgi:hypothetical protein
MVPQEQSAETLKLFLAIPQSRIDRDLREMPDNFDDIWPKIQAYAGREQLYSAVLEVNFDGASSPGPTLAVGTPLPCKRYRNHMP